jgi:Tol biopolymer transport system component
MHTPTRRCLGLLFSTLLVAGCSASVREDRTIAFAPDGKRVAFQHGREGIFLVETEGAEPTKIFQPDADVIATSAPLFSPTDKRLIFVTAKSAEKRAASREGLPAEQNPAGDLHYKQATQYTCWLRDEPKPGQPLNVPIFTAHCDHPGYIAANLAVRWHPDGKHILYISQDDKGRHGLFEYDLNAASTRQVCPQTGEALLFDWLPDNAHVVCVLADKTAGEANAGIWIGEPGDKHWWHVPDSSDLAHQELDDLLAARPVWTHDGRRFAFVTEQKKDDPKKAQRTLHVGDYPARSVRTVMHSRHAIRDMHWRPSGDRLGFLCGEETGIVYLIDAEENVARPLDDTEYCNFLGWDARGEQLAFVARQPLAQDPTKTWAFLLLPDVRARNRLLVAPANAPAQRRTVLSGMRVTFARWSPTEPKLSLWATFHPPFRSWLSQLLDLGGDDKDPLRGLSLRPGDPALVLDPATGERSWKAINAHEKVQIGHFHLLAREYAEAWRWYERAEAGAPATGDRSARQFVQRFARGRDALFFEAYCLDKLGLSEKARQRRRLFEESFLPELPAPPKAPVAGQPAPVGAADLQPTKEQLLHWHDLYIAEAFLSLDAREDAENYFRGRLQKANSESDRLSKALVLTQFLLMANKNEEYAELATDTVLPLLLGTWKARTQPLGSNMPNLILAYSDGLCLLPLFTPEFLASLSDQQVRGLVPRWQKLRPRADDDVKRLGIDLFLEAAARRLDRKAEQQEAAGRIAANPAQLEILGEKGVEGLLAGVRQAPEHFAALRQLSSAGH